MYKLKLDVDALKVEEFATEDIEAKPRGTVHGRGSNYSNCAGICEPDTEGNCTDWSVCYKNDTGCGETCWCSGYETCAPACPVSYATGCLRC